MLTCNWWAFVLYNTGMISLSVLNPLPDAPVMPRDEGQEWLLREHIIPYLNEGAPDHALVLACPPGFGKTHMMVRIADATARQGLSVFFAGGRRDMYPQVLAEVDKIGGDRDLWQAWHSQSLGDDLTPATCKYPDESLRWMRQGNRLHDYCKNACGFTYMQHACAYHLQALSPKPIVFGHHNHLWLGNPLIAQNMFFLVIGDEEPLNAVFHKRFIPAAYMVPVNMGSSHPFYNVCRVLQASARREEKVAGVALVEMLGGVQRVLEACRAYKQIESKKKESPRFTNPLDPPKTYSYFSDLADLLLLECDGVLDYGNDYLQRVKIIRDHDGWGLQLLLRHEPATNLPKHMIWCDATPHPTVYEAALRRKIKVVSVGMERTGQIWQVATRSNSISTMLPENEQGQREVGRSLTEAAKQVEYLVKENGYKSWGVATFKDGKEAFANARTMHFGGNRGSNLWRGGDGGPDAVFVVGTPLPPFVELRDMGAMLWNKRLRPFNEQWERRTVTVPFDGKRGDYWNDEDLAALTWMKRDAEIIQTVHRSGVNYRDVTVFLLSNLPMPALIPDKTLTLNELIGAPAHTKPMLWLDALMAAEVVAARDGYVTAQTLAQAADISLPSARKYLAYLIEGCGWTPVNRAKGKLLGASLELFTPAGVSFTEWLALRKLRGTVTTADIIKALRCDRATANNYVKVLATYAGYNAVVSARQIRASRETVAG